MTESEIQTKLVALLRANGSVRFCHPANEIKASARYMAHRWRMGVERGVPDLLIFTPPPVQPTARGAALELKSDKGRVSKEQAAWLSDLRAMGWLTSSTQGFEDSLRQLQCWGYIGL